MRETSFRPPRSIAKAMNIATDSAVQPDGRYFESGEEYARHFSNMKFYSITRSSMAWRDSLLFERIAGAVALDYCCGNGEVAVEMARRGAEKVYGIDISDVAVKNAADLAEAAGVGDICEFRRWTRRKRIPRRHLRRARFGALHLLPRGQAFRELSRV